MHASIFNSALLHLNHIVNFTSWWINLESPCNTSNYIKWKQFLKALWNVFMLIFFFKPATLDYNVSGGYILKRWSLNIKDFELASTPKNVSSLRWTTKNFLHFKSLKLCFLQNKICVTNCLLWDKKYGNSGFNYYTIMLIFYFQKHFTRKCKYGFQ